MKRGGRAFFSGVIVAVSALILSLCIIPLSGTAAYRPEVLRVGYFDYEGFLEQDGAGEYTGYGYEYLEEISTYTGWDYDFVAGTWEECLERLADGSIDLLCTAQYSEERAALYDYAKFETGTEYAMLLVRQDNQEIFYNDYESFDGLTVGMMVNSYQNTILPQYAAEHEFTYREKYYESATEMEEALKEGEIDAFLTGSLQKIFGAKVVAKFSPEPFYFITTKGNEEIIRQLNAALEEIQTSDVDYNSQLYDKYYGGSSAFQLAFTSEEHDFIVKHGNLSVAYVDGWPPISYHDDEENHFAGVLCGIMEEIAADSGLVFDYIPVDNIPKAEELVRKGQADLVCGYCSEYEQEAREGGLVLTKPIFEVPVTVSMREGMSIEAIKTIAVPEKYVLMQRYAGERFPDANILPFRDTEACIYAVEANEADAAFDNIYILDQYGKYAALAQIEPILSARTNFPVCIGIGKEEEPVLRSLLNKVIFQFDDKRLSEIVIDSTMAGVHVRPETIVKEYVFPVVAMVFVGFLAIVLFSRRRIKRYAFVDQLTGYSNEVKFLLSAQKLINGRGSEGYALLDLDIDKFKLINDMHSFETGNKVLKTVADVLNQELRQGELFCRETSDHFLILLRDVPDIGLNDRIMGIVRQITSVPQMIGQKFQYTVSCGVYPLPKGERDLHNAIGWASLAKNKAKEHHSDWVSYYNESMKERTVQEQEIVNRMENALREKEFEIYYQPKYRLEDEKVVGAEALVRWNQKDNGLINPDEFIPVFESNGFIIRLDLYVFEEVCRHLSEWLDEGKTPCPISVNLSRVHLSIPNFYTQYLNIMKKYRVPASLVEMELTESALFENHLQMISLIKELKRVGLSVSMDDFGSGFSSLNLLKDLPIDYLKMDKEFFNEASDSERGKQVIESVIYMAKRLSIDVVAEGVETREQVDYLKSIGCDIVQGYYFSKPLRLEEFQRRLFKQE